MCKEGELLQLRILASPASNRRAVVRRGGAHNQSEAVAKAQPVRLVQQAQPVDDVLHPLECAAAAEQRDAERCGEGQPRGEPQRQGGRVVRHL
eukprot:CAMPEP_0195594892 /NCGR_PEP_ID=MMETSP0815-20121206/1650_1 /TAXON_ID=97485 /ORGANISM="Prymnesium parvum, Strain Texoma1" /LENGTH=92 /DNA_ID=CAMNT_0040734109 /DNA_START=286 /DNA_END=561 /DNA_ORIENTATION=+